MKQAITLERTEKGQFAVYEGKDTIILKKIVLPTKRELKRISLFGQRFARQKAISPKDVLKDD